MSKEEERIDSLDFCCCSNIWEGRWLKVFENVRILGKRGKRRRWLIDGRRGRRWVELRFSLKIEGKEWRDERHGFRRFWEGKAGFDFSFVLKMMMDSATRVTGFLLIFVYFFIIFFMKRKRKEEVKLRIFYVMCI